jgi:hypothetical protein
VALSEVDPSHTSNGVEFVNCVAPT